MLMAIIEYKLNPGVQAEFESLIAALMPAISAIDGYLGSDAAASVLLPGRLYEISYWRDAAALARWSAHAEHAKAKQRGKEALLKWYRIRVGEVTRDWQVGEVPG